MPTLDTARRREDYESSEARREFLIRSYLGGSAYEGMLDRYPREDSKSYKERQKRAYYSNLYSAVIDSYISAVFEIPPMRSGPVPEDMPEVIYDATTYALAGGSQALLADYDGRGFPVVRLVNPANVLDYGDDWAIIMESVTTSPDPFTPRQTEIRYRVLMPRQWYLFSDRGVEIDSGVHSFDRAPLVWMDGSQVGLPVEDIANHVRRMYNASSRLDQILQDVTFPQFYIPASAVQRADGGDATEYEIGTAKILPVPDLDGGSSMVPGFVAPPNGPAELHQVEIERLTRIIYKLAGLEYRDAETADVRSGIAKAYDLRETNARLAGVAGMAEAAEREVYDLFGSGTTVEYARDYDVQSLDSLVQQFLQLEGSSIPDETKRYLAEKLDARLRAE